MPYVLQQAATNRIYTTKLINHYQLAYVGTKYWEDEFVAANEWALYLSEQQISDIEDWKVISVTEQQMKRFNVLAKNDLRNQLFWDGEHLSVKFVDPV